MLAEGLVLATVGALLGVLDGFRASLMGMRVRQLMIGTAGHFTIPWQAVGVAVLLALAVTMASCLLAAVRAGQANVLDVMNE